MRNDTVYIPPSDRDVEAHRGTFADIKRACSQWLEKRGLEGEFSFGSGKEVEAKEEGPAMSDIQTEYIHPPIPLRGFDWVAYRNGSEEGPRGYGKTKEEAIAD